MAVFLFSFLFTLYSIFPFSLSLSYLSISLYIYFLFILFLPLFPLDFSLYVFLLPFYLFLSPSFFLFSLYHTGLIHEASVTGIDSVKGLVSVEWFEGGETKGKEVRDKRHIHRYTIRCLIKYKL